MAEKTTKAAAETKAPEKNSDIYIEGAVTKALFGTTRWDKKEKYRITIKGEDIPYDEITAYDKTKSSFIPDWYKERNGYINLSSLYDFPCRYGNEKFNFSDWINGAVELTAPGSQVVIRIRQKDGSIYPVAVDILQDGEIADVWDGFDNK